jgi:hypothetical protein
MAILMRVGLSFAVPGLLAGNLHAFNVGFPNPLDLLCRPGGSTFLDIHEDVPYAKSTVECY